MQKTIPSHARHSGRSPREQIDLCLTHLAAIVRDRPDHDLMPLLKDLRTARDRHSDAIVLYEKKHSTESISARQLAELHGIHHRHVNRCVKGLPSFRRPGTTARFYDPQLASSRIAGMIRSKQAVKRLDYSDWVKSWGCQGATKSNNQRKAG